jgi:hypothetical protein
MRRFFNVRAAVAVVAFAGCEGASYGLTRHLDSGREVVIASTKATRWKSFDSTSDTTIARIGPRRVTVEPTTIKVDGDPVASIDEGTKRVTIFEQWETLLISADDVTVYEGRF